MEGLDPSPALAEAAYRMFLAEERVPSQLPAMAGLLDGRLRDADTLPAPLRKELRETLDRLVAATQLRHPAIGELARSVRFACFDRPLIAAARERAYRRVRDQLVRLAASPDAPGHAQLIDEVVATSQPLLPILGERARHGLADHEPMLEVLTRRYYKIRDLRDLRLLTVDGRQLATATYDRTGRNVRLVTALGRFDDLVGVLETLGRFVRDLPDAEGSVADLYLTEDEASDPDEMAERIERAIEEAAVPAAVRRLAVSVVFADGGISEFTFRPDDGRLREERVVRGLHPMISRRLRFSRLANFEVSRLPSVDDTYLFHCVAPEDPTDERFVALAEVRDLTPVHDASGALTSLPEVEHILAGCLEGIRRSQAERPARRRLQANHVFLYIWPTVEVPLHELTAAARRLAPMTEGLGLEEVLLCFGAPDETTGEVREVALRFAYQPGAGVAVVLTGAPIEPLSPTDDYAQRVLAARRRGTVYPYELIPLLTGGRGDFVEHDLDEQGRLVPVDRPPGQNRAGIVAGWSARPTEKHPEGIVRVALLGDPDALAGLRVGAGVQPHRRGPRPGRRDAACRWSGSRSRPARRSRATAAPRTWTGSPACCAASSRSPRRAAR